MKKNSSLKNWRQQSLEELEHTNWGDPDEAPTNLVRRCVTLAKIPVNQFTAADLRVLIGQQIGLPYLVPLAIEKLQHNVFLDAELYEGDLLESLLRLDTTFWKKYADWWQKLNTLIATERAVLEKYGISTRLFDTCKTGQ